MNKIISLHKNTEPDCSECNDTGEIKYTNAKGKDCVDTCQECCPHEDHDHFICINCGHEGEPSDYFDEDAGQDR